LGPNKQKTGKTTACQLKNKVENKQNRVRREEDETKPFLVLGGKGNLCRQWARTNKKGKEAWGDGAENSTVT